MSDQTTDAEVPVTEPTPQDSVQPVSEPVTTPATSDTIPVASSIPILDKPFTDFGSLPPFNRDCPFSGKPGGFVVFKDVKEDGTDGFFHGVSHDGSHIHATDQEGLEREMGVVAKVMTRVRELYAEHGSYADAHYKYASMIKAQKDATQNLQIQLSSLEAEFKVMEAREIVNQNTSEPVGTQAMADNTQARENLRSQIGELKAKLDNDEPHHGRVTTELGGYAAQERGF